MPDKPYFTCPKCGGWCFGRDTGIVGGQPDCLPTVRCHNLEDGSPASMWPDESYARRRAGLTMKPCGWHGVWPPAETE